MARINGSSIGAIVSIDENGRTELSPSELASKVEQAVREAIETVKQTLGSELEFDVFLVLDGREVRFVMDPVRL